MQITNSEYGSPYLVVCPFHFSFSNEIILNNCIHILLLYKYIVELCKSINIHLCGLCLYLTMENMTVRAANVTVVCTLR